MSKIQNTAAHISLASHILETCKNVEIPFLNQRPACQFPAGVASIISIKMLKF
jgi:hypothetical protein